MQPDQKKRHPVRSRVAASSGWQATGSDPILPQPAVSSGPYPTEVYDALLDAVATLRATADHVHDDTAALVARRLAADIEVVAPILFRRLVEAAVDDATSGGAR